MIRLKGKISIHRLGGQINMIPSEGGGGPLQAVTIYPKHEDQIVGPGEDYYGIVTATVKGVPRVQSVAVTVEESEPTELLTGVSLGAAVSITVEDYTA